MANFTMHTLTEMMNTHIVAETNPHIRRMIHTASECMYEVYQECGAKEESIDEED